MFDRVPTDEFSEIVKRHIQLLEKFRERIEHKHDPDKPGAVEDRLVAQHYDGDQEHRQKLHQPVQPQITGVVRFRIIPVYDRYYADRQEWPEQHAPERLGDVLADDDCNEGHERYGHRQTIPEKRVVVGGEVEPGRTESSQQHAAKQNMIGRIEGGQHAGMLP